MFRTNKFPALWFTQKIVFAFFLIQSIIPSLIVSGQASLRFNHLTSDQGLTSNTTNCLVKDKKGFLWIGTDAGLNRFDGSSVIHYSHIIGDSTSLINDRVTTLFVDDQNHIWIGTEGGLSVFYPESSHFANYSKISKSKTIEKLNLLQGVRSIGQFGDKMWLTTQNKLLYTAKDSIQFEIISDSVISPTHKAVFFIPNGMKVTSKGLWILSSKGPFYTEDGIVFFNRFNNPQQWPIFNTFWVSALASGADSIIYFSNFKFPGVYVFHPGNLLFDSIPFPPDLQLNGVDVIALSKTNDGKIWGSTMQNGVFQLDPHLKTYTLYFKDKNNPNSLTSNQTTHLISDDQGTIFISTDRGLQFASPIKSPFSIFNTLGSALPNESPSAIEAEDGTIWLATMSDGLLSMNRKNGQISHYPLSNNYNHIWNLCLDGENILMTTVGGIGTFSTQTKSFTPFNPGLPTTPEYTKDPAMFMVKDKYENLWIGFEFYNLVKYNIKTGEYTHFTEAESSVPTILGKMITAVTSITLDNENNIWVSFSSNQILSINMDNNAVSHISLPQDRGIEPIGFIQCIRTDQKKNLWIATSQSGLIKYHIDDNSYKFYDTRQGLSSNNISSILVDQQNLVWINASNGLNKFDPTKESFTFYDSSDGLSSNLTPNSSLIQMKDGTIYIWSENSITSFNPKDFSDNPNLPTLVLTSYNKSGEQINISDPENPLKLSFKDKMITFNFIGINFIDPTKTKYSYYLEGYDDNWNLAGSRPNATYTSLPPGNYKLHVKATNKDTWDVPETLMLMHVSGPFWKQWWFITLSFLSAMILAYGLNQYRFTQFKKILSMRNKISKDLHDDIGSTLSSISINSTAVEQMKPENFPEVISTVANIGQNARTAMENMSDIVWAINPKNDSFQNMMDRLQIFAIRLLEAKDIQLQFDIPDAVQSIKLSMPQRKNIYLILREAIHNVAKYSQATQCIVSAKLENKKIDLEVIDDGKGFDNISPSLGGNGFINMRQRAEELKALFHIQSELEKGTRVSLQVAYS